MNIDSIERCAVTRTNDDKATILMVMHQDLFLRATAMRGMSSPFFFSLFSFHNFKSVFNEVARLR